MTKPFLTALAILLFTPTLLPANDVSWVPAHHLAPQGVHSSLSSGDLNGDGTIDVSMFSPAPAYHYWNVGTSQNPAWQLDTSLFPDTPSCYYRAGSLTDMDQDGDLDLVVGCDDELLRCYWNVGTPQEPIWHFDTSEFDGIAVFVGGAYPDFGDLDGDGDMDLIVVVTAGAVQYIENTGTPWSPDWAHRGYISGVQIGPGGRELGALGDIDNDGDLDLVGAGRSSAPQCWENIGTPEAFEFMENAAMLSGVEPVGQNYGVELLDIDADGDLDLMISRYTENYLYLNQDYIPVEATTWGAIKVLYR